MNEAKSSSVYQIISFLLQYPNEQMVDVLPELKEEIQYIENNDVRNYLQQFMNTISRKSLDEWIQHYIECFDFEKTTNLYVTYLKLGEQRERGLQLLKLKNFYQSAGFDITDQELPDYLPLMLEFCANVAIEKSNELLQNHVQEIHEIKENLIKIKSWYIDVFQALLANMKQNGMKIIAKEKKELHSYAKEREIMKNRISWNIRQPKGGKIG